LRSRFARLWRLLPSERGQAFVEYVVLAALAVLVILGAVQAFFGGVAALFQRIGSSLQGF
jgi:Flp pilus assembly pilin Flp